MALLHTQASGGTAITAPTTTLLTLPQAQGAIVLFQTRYFVRLPVDDDTRSLSLSAQTSLQLTFHPEPVTIGMGASSWHRVTPKLSGDKVVFDLVRPVKVASLSSTKYQHVDLFRMDGSHKVDDASVSVAIHAGLPDDFTAARFTAGLSLPKANPSAANVLSLKVQGYPTSPRVKLSMRDPATGLDEVLWQWLDHPGEQTQACGVTITAQTWHSALKRALSLRGKDATEIILFVDVISDAPCRVVITPGQSARDVQSQAMVPLPILSGGGGALRFSGEQAQCQTVVLNKPSGVASKVQVRLSIVRSGGGQLQARPDVKTLGAQGLHLAGGDWLARPWPQDRTCFNVGFALPWWPLEGESALILSLHGDHVGHPGATALAQASVTTSTAKPHWLVFRWPEVPLQPGPYWVRLSVTEGGGLWLGQALDAPMGLARQCGQQAHQHLSTPLSPLVQTLSPNAPGASPEPGVTCTLQGQRMTLVADPAGQDVHWRATLATVPPEIQTAAAWPLVICCDNGALISLQDVTVERA